MIPHFDAETTNFLCFLIEILHPISDPFRNHAKAHNRLGPGTKIVALCLSFVALSPDRRSRELNIRDEDMNRRRMQIFYSGRVQGVGFRYTVKNVACGFDLTGTVRNLPDGRVELVAEGDQGELEEFRRAVQDSEIGGFIRNEDVSWGAAAGGFHGFEIVA